MQGGHAWEQGSPSRPEEDSIYLELELQVVVCHPTWVIGAQLRVSIKAVLTLKR